MIDWPTLSEETVRIPTEESGDSAGSGIRVRVDSTNVSRRISPTLPDVREAWAIVTAFRYETLRQCAASLLREVLLAIETESVRGLEDTVSYWYELARQSRERRHSVTGWEERLQALSEAYEEEAAELTPEDISEFDDEEILNLP